MKSYQNRGVIRHLFTPADSREPKTMALEITFTDGATEPILEAFDKEIDDNGYIIESESGDRVLTPENNEIKAENLAVLAEGSDVFIQDNFVSLVNFYHGDSEGE